MKRLFFLICVLLGAIAFGLTQSIPTVVQWSILEFEYPTPADRQRDLNSGFYVREAPVPIDVDVYYKRNTAEPARIFVTAPRFQTGIPVTLGEVLPSNNINGNPVIRPYPDWSWNRNIDASCRSNRLISVFRIKIDQCGRMWALDTGMIGNDQICAPQIVAFDVETRRVLHQFEFPRNLYEPGRSTFVTPAVDIRDNSCRDTFVYATDCQSYTIVVYDVNGNRAWKVRHRSMYPDPKFGRYTIKGESFDLMDGVFGLDVGPLINNDRKLFYHAMSANRQSWVYTSFLRNETNFVEDPEAHPEMYHTFDTVRPSQVASIGIDRRGIAFFGLHAQMSVNCWNTASREYGLYIDAVYRNTTTMQFASGLKVMYNRDGNPELWMMTNRFQKIMTGSIKYNEVNFRISGNFINNLLSGTSCGKPNVQGRNYGGFVDTFCEQGYNMAKWN